MVQIISSEGKIHVVDGRTDAMKTIHLTRFAEKMRKNYPNPRGFFLVPKRVHIVSSTWLRMALMIDRNKNS